MNVDTKKNDAVGVHPVLRRKMTFKLDILRQGTNGIAKKNNIG